MGKAVIGTYFKNGKSATKFAGEKAKLWQGKIKWHVLEFSNGYLVISESQIKACFPNLLITPKRG